MLPCECVACRLSSGSCDDERDALMAEVLVHRLFQAYSQGAGGHRLFQA